MSNQRGNARPAKRTVRAPATKFAHLRKRMEKVRLRGQVKGKKGV